MNDSKCPHCGEQMVWVGDMLSGGLACKTDHYVEAGYEYNSPLIPIPSDNMRKALEAVMSQPLDWGDKLRGWEGVDAQQAADHVNDRCNATEYTRVGNTVTAHTVNIREVRRRSGRTTAMLKQAMAADGPAICLFHSRAMVIYAKGILGGMGCRPIHYDYVCDLDQVESPHGNRIYLTSNSEAAIGFNGPVFVDHYVNERNN